jgi:alpha-beta hydrolase superfamily lysophospholipase
VGASAFHKLFANPQNPISDEVFGEYLSFLAKYGKT